MLAVCTSSLKSCWGFLASALKAGVYDPAYYPSLCNSLSQRWPLKTRVNVTAHLVSVEREFRGTA